MERYIIKIQNFSDLITNSSSELFVLKTDDSADVIFKMIKSYAKKENRLGGHISVETIRDAFNRALEFGIYDEQNKHWHTMQNTWLSRAQLFDLYKTNWGKNNITVNDNDLLIDINWHYPNTIKELLKNTLCAIRVE